MSEAEVGRVPPGPPLERHYHGHKAIRGRSHTELARTVISKTQNRARSGYSARVDLSWTDGSNVANSGDTHGTRAVRRRAVTQLSIAIDPPATSLRTCL